MLGNDYNKPCNERSFRSVLAATPNGKNQYLNSFKSFQLQNCNIDCRDTETMECHETLELHFFICWFVVSSSEQWRCDNHSSTPTECLRRRSKKWTTNRIHSSIFVVFIVVEIECFNRKVFFRRIVDSPLPPTNLSPCENGECCHSDCRVGCIKRWLRLSANLLLARRRWPAAAG